jgi:hypothetical protein
MKRNIILFILQFIFIVEAAGQPDIRGIALCDFSSYMTGDTVSIRGYSYDKINHTEKYLVKSHNLDVYVPASFIEVRDSEYSFWTRVWYMNRLSAITKNGWQNDSREPLIEDFRNYISAMEEDGLIYKDDYLLNYMQNLSMSIHPECLVKPDEKPVEIVVIRSIEPEIYAFDHGTIVISTGMIAGTNSEEELALLLAENTAHIVLEDNLASENHTFRSCGE